MKYYLKDLQNKQYEKYSEDFADDIESTDLFLMISQYIMSKLEQLDTIFNIKIEKKIFYEDEYEN